MVVRLLMWSVSDRQQSNSKVGRSDIQMYGDVASQRTLSKPKGMQKSYPSIRSQDKGEIAEKRT